MVKGISTAKRFCVMRGNNATIAQLLEMSLSGVGAVLRLARDARPMVK